MGDEFFLCEKQDFVPLFIDPDRVRGFSVGISDQQKGPQLIEASEPPEPYLGLRLSPLIEENGLVQTRQHQVLTFLWRPGQSLPEAWNNIRDQS